MLKNYFNAVKFSCITAFISISSLSYSQTNTLPPNGNVGIGTTSPTNKLQVNGTAQIDSSLVVKDSIIIHKSARVKSDLKVDGNAILKNNATVKNDFKVLGKSTLIGDVIIKDGDVKIKSLGDSTLVDDGILLINSNGKLKNGGEWRSLIYTEPQPQFYECLSDALGNPIHNAPAWRADPQRMFLIDAHCSPDPRLGVGVKPTAKLHVKLRNTSTLTPLLIEKSVSGDQTVPAYKLLQLDHTGLLYAREVKVNLDVWPDYVFGKEYDLMPLKDLDLFIKTNGHLPNIPKAEIIETEGLNLGQMNKLLMEKVEELTLYLLQQDQIQKAQDLRIVELEELMKIKK